MTSSVFVRQLLAWVTCWGTAGVLLGLGFAFVWDAGHMPRWLAPIALSLAGLFGGLVAGLAHGLSRRLLMGATLGSTSVSFVVALLCGAIVAAFLAQVGLGVTLQRAIPVGLLLSSVSFFVAQRWT